jgi:L-ascorbate metabolism protein UlaG (beta-lactamase superfamily)
LKKALLKFVATIGVLFLSAVVQAAPLYVQGKSAAKQHIPCGLGLVENKLFKRANYQLADVQAGHVKITFVGHSTFMMETTNGVAASTDYAGLQTENRVPDIVTMNNSHSSHYTDFLDPKIKHVLRGWSPAGGIARHHLKVKDMRIYNLPTNIFNFGEGAMNGNSVFVFEAGGLCMAHLGHLHHFLSKEQVAQLGRIDVLYVPIDGVNTLSHEEALHIIGQINPRIIMPMHLSAFGEADAFPETAGQKYKVKFLEKDNVVLNRSMLPVKTEVWFLTERF